MPYVILSAVAAGLLAGRKALGKEITGRKNKAIEAAAQETRHRIRADAMLFISRSFRRFLIATGIKLAILLILLGVHKFGYVDRAAFIGLTSAALAAFVIRDAVTNFPMLRLALIELRRHRWKPRKALTESIAARVFEEVLAEANSRPQSRTSGVLLTLAGENRERMNAEIAEAVADVARQTSWEDIRPYALSAAVRFGLLALLYSAAVWMLLHA
ncbi:MAG: hypothetical protein R3C04_03430 [Hyphomonas sp.]